MSGNFLAFDQDSFEESIRSAKLGLDLASVVVNRIVSDALYRQAQELMGAAQARLAPENRSEKLSQSAVIATPEVADSAVFVLAGFQANYAAFRDHGGTIVPVRADVLTIPQEPILDSNGESKFANPRQEPLLFVARWIGFDGVARAGLAMKVDGKLEIHWLFANSVTQKGSSYFTGTIQERAPQVGAVLAQITKDELQGRAA
jgi:hypothetical protein